MPKYIAFLRAINVGGHVVKMDQLKSLFERLGFSNVETFIASGNVIFDSPSKNPTTLEKKIEKSLKQALGYEVTTFLRTPAELLRITKYEPFPDEVEQDKHTIYVGFLSGAPTKAASTTLLSSTSRIDVFHLAGSELYWLSRAEKYTDSPFSGAKLEKCLGMQTTLRNSNTIKRLVAKYSGGVS